MSAGRWGDSPKIVVLSAYGNEHHLFDCLRTGVDAYLPKNASYQRVVEAIGWVHEGRKLLTPGQTHEVLEQFRVLAPGRLQERTTLSETELQILECLAQGENYEEIGNGLYLSERTIKRKVRSAIVKMDANNRTQAVMEALRRGLI